jgi:hypothetical protein
MESQQNSKNHSDSFTFSASDDSGDFETGSPVLGNGNYKQNGYGKWDSQKNYVESYDNNHSEDSEYYDSNDYSADDNFKNDNPYNNKYDSNITETYQTSDIVPVKQNSRTLKCKFAVFIVMFASVIFLSVFIPMHAGEYYDTDLYSLVHIPTYRDLESYKYNPWETYYTKCCRYDTKSNTGMHSDCKADGVCEDYLISSWSDGKSYNTTVNTCCYDYKNKGSKDYKSFCSFVCLNEMRQT